MSSWLGDLSKEASQGMHKALSVSCRPEGPCGRAFSRDEWDRKCQQRLTTCSWYASLIDGYHAALGLASADTCDT